MHVLICVLHQGLLDDLDRIPSAEQLAWSWPICGESLLSTRVRAPVSIKLHQTAIQKAQICGSDGNLDVGLLQAV